MNGRAFGHRPRVPAVIRDMHALREAGQVCRPVAELDVPAAAWRAAIRAGARVEGIRIRTFLIPSIRDAPARGEPTGDAHLPMVCAVRTDVAPAAPESRTDPLWWRRVDDLPVTVGTWRVMLRRTARRERITIRTFLIPPTCDEAADLTGQLVYAVWINPCRGPVHEARDGASLPSRRPRGVAVVRTLPVSGPTHAQAPGPCA
jgi:hypothetical protein